MLIIFDLDDTLIDTTGAITPFKLKLALKSLIQEAKLSDGSFDQMYQKLLQLDKKYLKASKAFLRFAADLSIPVNQVQKAMETLTTPLPDDFEVPMTLGAAEVLKELSSIAKMAIVTAGEKTYQWDKLKKAGIDTSDFCMIAISEDSMKKPIYQEICSQFAQNGERVWVVGDRPEVDLKPGFELGFNTIHMQWGRGAFFKNEASWANFSINDLTEIKGIIK